MEQRAAAVVDPNYMLGVGEAVEERGRRWRCADAGKHGQPGRPPLEVCGRWTLMGTEAASRGKERDAREAANPNLLGGPGDGAGWRSSRSEIGRRRRVGRLGALIS